ncbi:unnamed protein product [Malus baccata var. baccata]
MDQIQRGYFVAYRLAINTTIFSVRLSHLMYRPKNYKENDSIGLGTSFSLGKVSTANSSSFASLHLTSITISTPSTSSLSFSSNNLTGKRNSRKIVLRGQSLGFESELKLASDLMESEKEFPKLKQNLYPDIEPDSSGFLKNPNTNWASVDLQHSLSTPAYSFLHVELILSSNSLESGNALFSEHHQEDASASHSSSKARDITASQSSSLFFSGLARALPPHLLKRPFPFAFPKLLDRQANSQIQQVMVGSTILVQRQRSLGIQPVVFLHGGPGGGTSPSNRRFFDPEFYRIILFDQRGAGKSTPHACLVENTTWDLISDIEKLREHLEIPEWQVFGGSWGSTLALAYGQSHPDKVNTWEPFRDLIPENERDCFVGAYKKRLNSDDQEIQGRYDMCCPMMSAWDLHKAWPEADFKVIPDARHSANEPGIAAELVAATEKLKHIKKGQWEDIQKFVPENKQQSSRLGADSS